jgi:hypothetical protein
MPAFDHNPAVDALLSKGSINTYRQLKEALELLTEDQLDANISVLHQDEYYPAEFRIDDEGSVLDEKHPILFTE